jgi:hypothetical protein
MFHELFHGSGSEIGPFHFSKAQAFCFLGLINSEHKSFIRYAALQGSGCA